MQNRWNDTEAGRLASDLDMRAYSSRLIGMDPELVLHGGGNTSMKGQHVDLFGEDHAAIWVKASGFDLGRMGREGFTGLHLDPLLRLARLNRLTDHEMVNAVNCARIDSTAAPPSVEALVHAVIPFRFVDHSHADAVLTISNSHPDAFGEIYGDRVAVLPYVKPGFGLAVQFRTAMEEGLFAGCDAVILQHHGVFTFANEACDAYHRMIDVVTQAEAYLAERVSHRPEPDIPPQEPLTIARARKAVALAQGAAVLSLPAGTLAPEGVSDVADAATRGTLTPEHVIHNKPFPAVLDDDPEPGLRQFLDRYTAYVDAPANPHLTPLPAAPHWAMFGTGHVRSFGTTLKSATISRDVTRATLKALTIAQDLGEWQGLSPGDLRDLEYWELEQAKLARRPRDPVLAGRIAVVSGAASGIGLACAQVLHARGAVVVGLDVNPGVETTMNAEGFRGIAVDLTNEAATARALATTVRDFGGLDIVVSNAGIFKTGHTVETMEDGIWDATLAVNLTAHRKLLKHAIPFLRHGLDPGVVFIGSRNVRAPGAGASAYSVSKAGLTQLMRVLALELAVDGITVNAVHPDAVFDTNLWTPEVLATSAARYGLSVEEYKTRNLLAVEVRSRDVGNAVAAFLDGTFRRTTGAQVPVDGGNARVI